MKDLNGSIFYVHVESKLRPKGLLCSNKSGDTIYSNTTISSQRQKRQSMTGWGRSEGGREAEAIRGRQTMELPKMRESCRSWGTMI